MRGAVKLPRTPERRLGATAHRQAEYACGGPTDAEPTPKGEGPPPFNLTVLRSRARIREAGTAVVNLKIISSKTLKYLL